MSLLLSVIIPTYQRPGDLARCLDQLAPGAQTLPFDQYEVIVTDDEGKGSETEQLVKEKYAWARWVPAPGQGPAANRNNGARYANGEWLVFTDDDCIPQRRWLFSYASTIQELPQVRVIEGATLPSGPRKNLSWQSPVNREGGRLWSCNLAVETNLFGTLGGFDTDYPFALEDIDFKTRILKSEAEWTFNCEAAVIHPWHRKTALELFKRQMKEVEGWKVFAIKHPSHIRQFKAGYLLDGFLQIWKDIKKSDFQLRGLVAYSGLSLGRIIKRIAIIYMSYTEY